MLSLWCGLSSILHLIYPGLSDTIMIVPNSDRVRALPTISTALNKIVTQARWEQARSHSFTHTLNWTQAGYHHFFMVITILIFHMQDI